MPLLAILALATACSNGSSGGGGDDGEEVETGTENDALGSAVAASGDTIVAGAPQDDDAGSSSGSAYVYRFDGMEWVEEQKLVASDGSQGDFFGSAVAVSGDTIVVGAKWDDDAGAQSGSAYVYRFDGMEWVEEQKLVASDAKESDFFGRSVSVSGDVIAVGVWNSDYIVERLDQNDMPIQRNISNGGSVYVFRFDGVEWVEEQKLIPSDAANDDYFGYSVSVDGDTIAGGARGDDDSGANSGSVYVFFFDGIEWLEEQKLVADDASLGDLFGYSVSVDGDTLAVGAQTDDAGGTDSGSAYVFGFDGTSWMQEQKLAPTDSPAGDLFGTVVSLSGDTLAVGAYLDDAGGTDGGAAYAFVFDGGSWALEDKLVASDAADEDQFGAGAAASGDTIAVGAPNANAVDEASGAVYVFGFDGASWMEEQKLLPKETELE